MNKDSICKNCRFLDRYMFIPWKRAWYVMNECEHPNKHKDVMEKIHCEDFERKEEK